MFFFSDRNNRQYELYSIDRDGGGLRQLTKTDGKRSYPVPSPDGSTVVAMDTLSTELFLYKAGDFTAPAALLPALPGEMRGPPGSLSVLLGWSRDGRALYGASGGNLWMLTLASGQYRRLAAGVQPFSASWLPDDRRLLLNREGRLVLLDTGSGVEREVLALRGESIGMASLSPDANYLYFLRGSTTGDIWLARFDAAP
jgi:Tol biopolymer transport system component